MLILYNKNSKCTNVINDNLIKDTFNDGKSLIINTNLDVGKEYCGKCFKLSCLNNAPGWDYNKNDKCLGTPVVLKAIDVNNTNTNMIANKYPNLFSVDSSHYEMYIWIYCGR